MQEKPTESAVGKYHTAKQTKLRTCPEWENVHLRHIISAEYQNNNKSYFLCLTTQSLIVVYLFMARSKINLLCTKIPKWKLVRSPVQA